MMILRVSKGTFLKGREDAAELRVRGMNVEQAETGGEALEYLRTYDYDAVLIDWQLPDTSGLEVTRLARQAGHRTPIVILAETATMEQRIRTLDLGADDFITMPCDPAELLARLRAVIRRHQGHARSTLRIGPVELRLDRREVTAHGQKLALTRREYGTLELLFLRQGAILNKVAFLNHLYCGSEEPEVKSVDVTICRVRKKLASAGVHNLIDTVWGCGYILRTADGAGTADTPAEEARKAPVAETVDLASWRDERARSASIQATAL